MKNGIKKAVTFVTLLALALSLALVPVLVPAHAEDDASGWDCALLKIHVKNAFLENWDNYGIYIRGTDEMFDRDNSVELVGGQPGKRMITEHDSETWLAFAGTFANEFFVVNITNYVTDYEAAEGAISCCTDDFEITNGEYWITIDFNEDGGFRVSIETEAPEDYDGTGLGDEDVVTYITEEGPQVGGTNVPKTGDAVPYAAAFIAVFAAGAAAVIRKKTA